MVKMFNRQKDIPLPLNVIKFRHIFTGTVGTVKLCNRDAHTFPESLFNGAGVNALLLILGQPVDFAIFSLIIEKSGAVAQLGERLVRSEKAASSTLVCSIRG